MPIGSQLQVQQKGSESTLSMVGGEAHAPVHGIAGLQHQQEPTERENLDLEVRQCHDNHDVPR